MLWMLGCGICFVAVIGIVRYMGESLPAVQASFLRYLIGLMFFLPYLSRLSYASFNRSILSGYFIRAIFHSLGVVCWFYSMSKLPVAEVTAIGYLTPVLTALGAVLFFKERISYWRISAIVLAFVGVLLILRPGFQDLLLGHVAQLFATVFFAGSYLLVKKLTYTENTMTIVAMLTVVVTIVLAPVAALVWIPPTINDMVLLFFTAVFATVGHFFMTRAFTLAPMVVLQPITFFQLVWATLVGIFVFGESVNLSVLLGGVVILVSVTLISYRESLIKK